VWQTPKDFSPGTEASLFQHTAARCQSPLLAKLSRRSRSLHERNRQYVRLIYAVRSTSQDASAPTRLRELDKTMLHVFQTTDGLDDIVFILSIALVPSIVAVLLAFYSLCLPDDSKR